MDQGEVASGANDTKVQQAVAYFNGLNTGQRELFMIALMMQRRADVMASLNVVGIESLLEVLKERGGWVGPLGEAGLLCCRKGADYNAGQRQAKPELISKDDYFPLGLPSYAQMLHVKSQRLLSLAVKKGEPENESARDTCLDMINYAAFAADWLARQAVKENK